MADPLSGQGLGGSPVSSGLPSSQPSDYGPPWWRNPFGIFPSGTTPANPMVGNVATQPVSGDSLTQFFRSLTNLTGTTGENLLNQGGATTAMGLGGVGQGFQTMQPSVDFYTKLLSGDPKTMTEALAPTSALIGQQFQRAGQGADANLPMGGYRSQVMSELPFAQAGMVGNAVLGLQPAAAQGLGQLGGLQGQLGLGVAGIGSQQTGQGLASLESAIQAALEKMGINIQGGTAHNFNTVAQGINALI
ncbi:MAG TPA: hypothetical protein VEL77_15160 [Rugosimonospora sp.]|nr:hypothetical protein [Rugosimonospora sp.]